MEFSEFLNQNSDYKNLAGRLTELRTKEGASFATIDEAGKAIVVTPERVAGAEAVSREIVDTTAMMASMTKSLHARFDAEMVVVNPALAGTNTTTGARKSILDQIYESDHYKNIPNRTMNGVSIPGLKNWSSTQGKTDMHYEFANENPIKASRSLAMKANEISTGVTAPSFYQGQAGIVPYTEYPASLFDLLPTFQATNGQVTYFRETSLVNAAASRAESTALGQSTFTLTRQSDNAQVVGGYFIITEEEFMDRPDIMDYITFKSNLELRIAVETQILTGNNTGTNFNGLYNQAGGTYSVNDPTNQDPVTGLSGNPLDGITRGIHFCQVNGVCVPNLGVIHPNNYLKIRLLKDLVGNYIFGTPNTPMTDIYIGGIRFVQSLYATVGSALLGDFNAYYQLGINQGIYMDLVYNGSDPINLCRTARFWFRGMNQVRRPLAFETVTNLPSN